MRRFLIYFITTICIVATIIIEGMTIHKLKNECGMYRDDIEILTSDRDTFRTRNNELAAEVRSLQLTQKDYEKIMEEDASRIKALKKRNEYLEHAIKTTAETKVEVRTIIKDSTVYRDRVDTIHYFHWEDKPWEYIHGEMIDGNLDLTMCHHEELDLAIFLEYKKFLWWKIKLKGYNVDVVSKNPYTKDIDIDSVTIK